VFVMKDSRSQGTNIDLDDVSRITMTKPEIVVIVVSLPGIFVEGNW
jgi:hypothetical protein